MINHEKWDIFINYLIGETIINLGGKYVSKWNYLDLLVGVNNLDESSKKASDFWYACLRMIQGEKLKVNSTL